MRISVNAAFGVALRIVFGVGTRIIADTTGKDYVQISVPMLAEGYQE